MLKPILAVAAAALLLTACESSPPPPQAVTMAPAASPVGFFVTFATGQATLSAEAQGTIQQASAAYRSRSGARVAAVGHTDTVGAADFNRALSMRRAEAVRDALVSSGVPATAISVAGTGEGRLPVQTGDNVSEQRNRSVEIVVGGRYGLVRDEAAYCAALSRLYREYSRAAVISARPAAAMAECAAGNYAAGIPVLEHVLTNDKIPLPAM
jgi:hypothetical protein